MAKKDVPTGAPAMLKTEPSAHISWPPEGVKLSGDVAALAMGKKIRIMLEGTVKGYGMHEYGCDLDMKVKTVMVDGVSDGAEEQDEGPSMVEMMGKMGKKKKPY